jgi:hypothetical protein
VKEPGWRCLAFRGSDSPVLAFRGREGLFALSPQWRASILWYLFWRLLRLRSDAIFFHASALGIFGERDDLRRTQRALESQRLRSPSAARGHNFLSDEIAGYLPASGELMPVPPARRHQAGAPRRSRRARGLVPGAGARIERDGFMRESMSRRSLQSSRPPVPAAARIVFLRGFAAPPVARAHHAGRGQIVELQPLMSSFPQRVARAPHCSSLTRLLSHCQGLPTPSGRPGCHLYLPRRGICKRMTTTVNDRARAIATFRHIRRAADGGQRSLDTLLRRRWRLRSCWVAISGDFAQMADSAQAGRSNCGSRALTRCVPSTAYDALR